MSDTTLDAAGYLFLVDPKRNRIGLRAVLTDGQTVTLPFSPDEAEVVGAMLSAHADALKAG